MRRQEIGTKKRIHGLELQLKRQWNKIKGIIQEEICDQQGNEQSNVKTRQRENKRRQKNRLLKEQGKIPKVSEVR